MSLFKAREWWSTTCGNEEFDKGCLCIANIDNSNDKDDKIIVGSYSGTLRIYYPRPEKQEDGVLSSFRPDELLLERQLNEPILNVSSGHFVSASDNLHLAVLHPKRLCVYNIAVTPGSVDHGTHYHLSLLYEHKLQRSAYCLVVGPFGEVKGKDFMCVQSLDGTLTVFEQESFAFSRFLPGFLLPGPMIYVPKTDSFVTASAGWNLESYRFQILAVAKDPNVKEETENITYGKRVLADWTFSLGEAVIDIALIEYKTAPSTILVLGERNVFAFKQNGVLRYIKKLDYSPRCFFAHHGSVESAEMTLIASHQSSLLVYRNMNLCWAAQLPCNPIAICIGRFSNLRGVVVLLSESGDLVCCYMGTEPSLLVVPVLETREIDFIEAEHEMYELRKIIKATNSAMPRNKRMETELSVSINVPYEVDTVTPGETFALSEDGDPVPSITAKLHLESTVPLQDVRMMVYVEPPLAASQTVFTFSSISEYSQVLVTVQMKAPHLLPSLELKALAVYTNSNGAPRVAECTALLPLQLVAKACAPFKSAAHKVTVETNKQAVAISELFPEFADPSSTGGNAFGFEYFGGQQVVVLSSKTSQRYRIQSDCFPALWLLTSELIRRLHQHFKHGSGVSEIKFTHSSNIPLADYFSVITEHFACRQKFQHLDDLLSQRAAQFRVVQKRLLTKMKDKTITNLNNLDTLLEATHRQIMSLTDSIEDVRHDVDGACCALNCATHLVTLLVKLTTNMSEEDFKIFQAVLSPHSETETDEGWEESVNVGLAYILSTCLVQPGKESSISADKLEMSKDIGKLRKHLAIVVDRLLKGASFVDSKKASQDSTNNNEQETTAESNMEEDTSVPVGSRFAEQKDTEPRIRSARRSALSMRRLNAIKPSSEISVSDVPNMDETVAETIPEADDSAFF